MAEVKLVDNIFLKKARRAFRRGGIRLTVRNGRIYTIKAREIVQPRTEKQLKNWAIFTEANRLTDQDLKENGRKRYWQRRAAQQGYKTARGCAKAHFVKMLKEGRLTDKTETEMVADMKKSWITRRKTRKPRPVWSGGIIDASSFESILQNSQQHRCRVVFAP